MTIKLHAKLAAYSRVDSNMFLPKISEVDAGKLLGVSNTGSYELKSDLDNRAIDNLFDSIPDTGEIIAESAKELIDSLFEEV